MIVLITKSPSENGTFSVFKGQGAAFVKLRLVRVVAYLENKPKENETSLREYVKHVLTKIDKTLFLNNCLKQNLLKEHCQVQIYLKNRVIYILG